MHITLEEEERDLLILLLVGLSIGLFLLLSYRLIRRSTSRLLTPIVGLGLLASGQGHPGSAVPGGKRVVSGNGLGRDLFVTPSKGDRLLPSLSTTPSDSNSILSSIYLSPSRVALSIRRMAKRIQPDEWGTSYGFFPLPYVRIWVDSPWVMGAVESWFAGLGAGIAKGRSVMTSPNSSPKVGDMPVFEVGSERKVSSEGRLQSGLRKELKIQMPTAVRLSSPKYPGLEDAAEIGYATGHVTPTRESFVPMDSLGLRTLCTKQAKFLLVPNGSEPATPTQTVLRPRSPNGGLERRASPSPSPKGSVRGGVDSDDEYTSDGEGAESGGALYTKKETRSISPVHQLVRGRPSDVGNGQREEFKTPIRTRATSAAGVSRTRSHEKLSPREEAFASPRISFSSPGSRPIGSSLNKRQKAIKAFYTLGCLAAIIGMTIAISLVTWQAFSSWFGIYRVVLSRLVSARSRSVQVAGEVVSDIADVVLRKRVAEGGLTFEDGQVDAAALASVGALPKAEGLQFAAGWRWSMGGGMGGFTGSVIQPIIPGVTVPLAHALPLLLALFSAQIVHELGHIVAAAVDAITPAQITATLHLLLPSASVALPSSVAYMPAVSRMRMAASGPWHNFVHYLVIALIGWTGVMRVFYHDYTDVGRAVVGLQAGSPLEGHLPAGAVVEYLDDVAISGTADVWSQYLLSDDQDETRGWCVDKKRYQATLQAPCPDSAPIEFTTVPFSNASSESAHCLPAYPLLTTRTWACPCTSGFQVCVKPTPASNVLRIQWMEPDQSWLPKSKRKSTVLLWSGARDEVWRSIRVSRYAGRGGLVGRRIALLVELLCGYVATLSLTLFLLNLLPLPSLDGSHVLEALLDYQYPNTRTIKDRSESPEQSDGRFGSEKEPVEDLDTPSPSVGRSDEYRTRRRIQHLITWGTAGLVATSVGGMIMTLGLQYSA